MPFPRYITRHRFCLAGLLLIAAALAGLAMLRSWEARSPERVQYDRIQVGMTAEQVDAVVTGERRRLKRCAEYWWESGPWMRVHFNEDMKVDGKEFDEGDQSLTARARRLVERVRRW
jgi:hypothetical protein